MYATNSVNIRTQGDLNLHADNNININAAKDLNIAAGENINVTSEKATKFKAGTDFNQYTIGKYTVKVNDAMSMSAAGEASYASEGVTYINGSKVNLNTGSTGTTPAEVSPIPIIAHTDTLFDATKGYASAPGKLLSIVSRAPAHAPWANWGQGVDVKVTTSASASLPSQPTAATTAVNNAVSPSPSNPVTAAVASTVPDQGAVSNALDKNATATMVGAVARDAAYGSAADAVKAGTGVVTDALGKATAVVGPMALTAQQLESAGDLKPGAAKLINGLVSQGKTVTQAMTNNLFTGTPGAENLSALSLNIDAQVKATVTNFQQSQTALTQAGVITGKEAPGQIAGLVMAGAADIKATTDFVKNATGAITGAVGNVTGAVAGVINNVTGAVGGALSSVSNAISSGNFAGNMSQTVTGGLGSIAGALSGVGNKLTGGLTSLLDSAKGVAGSAFSAVTAAFKPLAAGVPQNLKAIAEKNATEAASAGAGLASAVNGDTGGLTSALNSATGALDSAVSSVTGGLTGTLTGAITGAVSAVTGAATNLVSSVTSGLTGIPGGQNTISSVVNNSLGAINTVPGLGPVTDLVKNTSTAITNSISGATAALSSVTGVIGGATTALNSVVSSATGALSSITGQANSLLNKGLDAIKSGTQSLASLATGSLPPAAAAQLNAAINSLSAGGPTPIKLPTVAVGTNDRSEITAQLSSVLGSVKIPLPNFTAGINNAVASKADDFADKAMALLKEKEKQDEAEEAAWNAYNKAKATLPQGDPELFALYDVAKEEGKKTLEIAKKMSALTSA
jgi:phage-related protein